VLGQVTGTLDHETHHGPDSGVSHHLTPYSILCDSPRHPRPNVTFSRDSRVGIPKLSRNCLGWSPGLCELITPDCEVWSQRGLNQTCDPRWDLSNDVSHSQFGGREEVDSRLLVVGSQTASLTPGPCFAHNLGYICSNDQCEAIFYIYASRPFQWHKEHLNARCFGPCCRTLNIRESRRTPNPHFFQVLGFTPTLGQSRVATIWDSNSHNGSSLGSIRVHSLTLFAPPGTCDVIPMPRFWPATLQALALVVSPRLGLWHYNFIVFWTWKNFKFKKNVSHVC
jgi:hypothetical protein